MMSPLPGLRTLILSSRVVHLPGLSSCLTLREYHDYPNYPKDKNKVPQERRFRMSKKWHYMHGHSSNEGFTQEGVSDKTFPIPIDWRRPKSVM